MRLLTRLRGSAAMRTAALWLIALTVCPFSAPFKTFDLTSHSGDISCPNDKIESDDLLIADLAINSLPSPGDVISTTSGAPLVDRPVGFSPLVLRL